MAGPGGKRRWSGAHRHCFTPGRGSPRDHGPHPEYATEWWYYTGNLESADGRHFGFQLTFFRSALASTAPEAPDGATGAPMTLPVTRTNSSIGNGPLWPGAGSTSSL